jgi:hypothetical protein
MTLAGFRFAVRDMSYSGAQQFMSDRWVVATATAMPSFPASNLGIDLLSLYWSAYNQRASNTWIQAMSDDSTGALSTRSIGAIGLLGINRRMPTALIPQVTYTSNTARIRVDSYPIADRIRPTLSISSSVNLTGDSHALNHPIHPPDDPAPAGYAETKLSPTNTALATSIVVSFPNFYSGERALSGTQTFRVHVRDVNTPGNIPAITAVIWQRGAPAYTLISPTYEKVSLLNSSGGFIATYTFTTANLVGVNDAIDMHVNTTTACDFIGMEMLFNLTGHLFDSGVVDYSGQDLTMIGTGMDLTLNTGISYVHVEMSDFCYYGSASYSKVGGGSANATIFTSVTNPGEPDGRFHAGRFLAADAIVFPINGLAGYNLSTSSDASPSRTRSGSLHGSRAANEWMEADLSIIGISRVLQQRLERLFRALGIMRNPTLLIPDPLMTEGYIDEQTTPRWVVLASKAESHIGRLTGIDSDVGADGLNHTRDRWDMAVHVVDHSAVRSGGG